jgi:hypothetical protein
MFLRNWNSGSSPWASAPGIRQAVRRNWDGDLPDVGLDQGCQREHGRKAEPGKDSENDKKPDQGGHGRLCKLVCDTLAKFNSRGRGRSPTGRSLPMGRYFPRRAPYRLMGGCQTPCTAAARGRTAAAMAAKCSSNQAAISSSCARMDSASFRVSRSPACSARPIKAR